MTRPTHQGEKEVDLRLLVNPWVDRTGPYPEECREILSLARHRAVAAEIMSWPGYARTPLVELPYLASSLGVGRLWYKDEGQRFGLQSFKALGGPFGVLRVLQQEIRDRTGIERVSGLQLIRGQHREAVAQVHVVCATDGNHGRAVAWGAELFGCRCTVYLPAAASPGREAAIAAHGAEIVRVDGDYDDAIRRADEDANRLGLRVVSDHAYPGFETIPRDVMQGYTTLVSEILEQLAEVGGPDRAETELTHVLVQGGVGGFAAAVLSYLWESLGPGRPSGIVIEPHGADCIYRSAEKGRLTPVPGTPQTFMACLCAGEVSTMAWPILKGAADAFITIPDAAAVKAMRLLARGEGGDPQLVAGESGAAGLAGLLQVAGNPNARAALELRARSRVLVVGTEGATDPQIYREIVEG